MREAQPEFEAVGAKTVIVSSKSAAVATAMQKEMPFPLLIDADNSFRKELEIRDLTLGEVASVEGLANYAKGFRQFRNISVQPTEATKSPAIVVFDADQNETWRYVGAMLGDYPAISEIVQNVPST